MKYPKEIKTVINDLLMKSALPRDALPYTSEFDDLKATFAESTDLTWGNAEFWQALSSIGKEGGLGTKTNRKRAPRAPTLTTEQQLELLRLFPEGIGSRDQLPYTEKFDDLHKRFSQLTNLTLSKHEFWRVLSRVAKLSRKPKPVFDVAPLGGLAPPLVQFLERTNPWWRGQPGTPVRHFHRWAFDEALKRLDSGIAPAVAIRGPRQVGKTTIQEQLVEYLIRIRKIPPAHILRVQFDEVPALGALVHPVETIVRWYEENVLREPINAVAQRKDAVYLFFDELQNLPQWSAQLKALVDHVSARTLVTGSSALRIARARDSLAGRLSMIELGPLRLYEIAGIRRLGPLPPFAQNASLDNWTQREFWLKLIAHTQTHHKLLNSSLRHFSRVGGYPRCHQHAKQDIGELARHVVDAVVNRTIEHDPVGRPHKKGPDRQLVKEVFRLVCRYAGQHVSPRRIAQEVEKILSFPIKEQKVTEAIQFLVDSMLVHAVQPLELLLKKQSHAAKLCLCDHFLRNAWLQETIPIAPDELAKVRESTATLAGHIIESLIGYYLMGVPGLELSWFPARPNEPEIDFIMTIGMQRIPIEIKYVRRPLKPEDYAGIQAFCAKKHYNAPFGLVVTQTECREIDNDVIALPASSLLLVR